MFTHPTTLSMVSAQRIKWAEERQKIIAQNIAHQHIDGYVTKDVTDLNVSHLQQARLSLTHYNHLGHMARKGSYKVIDDPSHTAEEVDGHGQVSLEHEMMKMGETATHHQAMIGIRRFVSGLFRIAVDK